MGRFSYDAERGFILPDRHIEPMRGRRLEGSAQQALMGYGASAATDPYFSSVVFLAKPSGSNGSTTFTDLSTTASTLTAVGNAQNNNGQTKYTTASLLCDGNGDSVTAPNNAAFDFGAGKYTLEAWFYVASFLTNVQGIFGKGATSASYTPFLFYVSGTANKLAFLSSANGSSWGVNITGSATFTVSAWHHLAVDYDLTTVRIYVDGAVSGSQTISQTVTINTNAMSWGSGHQNGDYSCNGYLGPSRITKGVARYAGVGFTPGDFPTS